MHIRYTNRIFRYIFYNFHYIMYSIMLFYYQKTLKGIPKYTYWYLLRLKNNYSKHILYNYIHYFHIIGIQGHIFYIKNLLCLPKILQGMYFSKFQFKYLKKNHVYINHMYHNWYIFNNFMHILCIFCLLQIHSNSLLGIHFCTNFRINITFRDIQCINQPYFHT